MGHLRSGLGVLASGGCGGEGGEEDVGAVLRVFEELDLQATLLDDGRVPRLVLLPELEHDAGLADTTCSLRFTHLDEAQQALMRLRNALLRFLTANMHGKPYTRNSLPASVLKQRIRLIERFRTWLARFDGLRSSSSQTEDTVCRGNILLIHWHVSNMILEADYPADASVFGAIPNMRARTVLGLADSVIDSTRSHSAINTERKPQLQFSIETGIIAPLFVLAMKCADEYVSTRATRLLAALDRREGLYDAQSMVVIIEKFASARQQKRLQSDRESISEITSSSFEEEFSLDPEGRALRLDQLAERL
ncbi:hypothetical protein OPT61_g4952 [Boeremia exigua]|uniref:Uncharacterized protein n=1 Tax=Boeremia exigua TaxID=749465 RepID=A0ACC2ICA4_9PLEO|nr:hypothetical protein OPT61_g4952 [Boeremia exigua]